MRSVPGALATGSFYYFLQCLVALCVTRNKLPKAAIGVWRRYLFITLFAVPAG